MSFSARAHFDTEDREYDVALNNSEWYTISKSTDKIDTCIAHI